MGRTALMNHVGAGQYLHQDGLYFGGYEASWSNTTLRAIMGELRDHCSDVISFDLHTGAGAYGHPMLMAIAEHDYPGMADAERIYGARSEEHTSELQSLMRISYAVFCLKKKKALQQIAQ